MSTVQSNLLKLVTRVDPTTKSGKKFQGVDGGVAISDITSNGGANLLRVTAANHGFATGDFVSIANITGTVLASNTAANPYWVVTYISSSQFDLVGSAYTGIYTSGGTVTKYLVGSVNGSKFTRQRILDIYNESRMALFNALYEMKGRDLDKYIYGTALSTSMGFTYSSPYTSASIPSGFIRLIGIVAANGNRIILLPNNLLPEALLENHPYYTVSGTNLLAFQVGSYFKIPGSFATEAGTATINYYGITSWVWATDVLPGTTQEVFSADIEPILIEIGEALANEQSNTEALNLAKTLLSKR